MCKNSYRNQLLLFLFFKWNGSLDYIYIAQFLFRKRLLKKKKKLVSDNYLRTKPISVFAWWTHFPNSYDSGMYTVVMLQSVVV